MDLLNRVNSDIQEYEETFDKITLFVYLITMPLTCLYWAWGNYLPIILNKWFSCPASVQFANADASWNFLHAFCYNCWHPPMNMAEYFNSCTSSGQLWYLFLSLPLFWLVFSIIFLIINRIVYWTIWNHIIGPILGDYLRPIVDSAFQNLKH